MPTLMFWFSVISILMCYVILGIFADEMIVTSPLRTNDITTILFGGAAGRVYIYNGKQASSGNVTGHCKSWVSPCPEDWVRKHKSEIRTRGRNDS